MRTMQPSAVFTLLILLNSFANASTIVDPDAFAAGTDISNAFPDVVLTAILSGSTTGPVFSATELLASTGTRVFSASTTGDATLWWQGSLAAYPTLRADFANGATSVSIDVISEAGDFSDYGTLEIFDGSNNSLGFISSAEMTVPGQITTLTLTSATPVAYAIMGGNDTTGDDVYLDNLRYDSYDATIPEPSTSVTLAGLAFCFAVAGWWRRRQKAYSA